MQPSFSLRSLSPEDGPAYATLLANSPDTGRVGVAGRFEIDPYRALMGIHSDTTGVVAETPGYPGFVGGGLIRFAQGQWGSSAYPSALLNTLVVHPDFRRRGLASQLAKWRQEHARSRFGGDGIIWAIIQRSNTGSERTAQKWATEFLADRLVILPVNVRTTSPPPSPDLTVRPVEPGELDQVAEQQNRFYQNYDFYPPDTGASLAAWLGESPFDTPMRHSRVVTDRAGNILAGMAVAENFRVRTSVVTRMPAAPAQPGAACRAARGRPAGAGCQPTLV